LNDIRSVKKIKLNSGQYSFLTYRQATMEQQNRQLAAILFTDIVGYTAMMQKDEQNALAVTRHYIATLKQSAEAFHGRILMIMEMAAFAVSPV